MGARFGQHNEPMSSRRPRGRANESERLVGILAERRLTGAAKSMGSSKREEATEAQTQDNQGPEAARNERQSERLWREGGEFTWREVCQFGATIVPVVILLLLLLSASCSQTVAQTLAGNEVIPQTGE